MPETEFPMADTPMRVPEEEPTPASDAEREGLEFSLLFNPKVIYRRMYAARDGFSPRVRELLERRKETGQELSSTEQAEIDAVRDAWLEANFGIAPTDAAARADALWARLDERKHYRMHWLQDTLKNLDRGILPVEFSDSERKLLRYDTGRETYVAYRADGTEVLLSEQDVLSDYAWGIRYAPDPSSLMGRAYRESAKHILANETRRDIEDLANKQIALERFKADSPVRPRMGLAALQARWTEKRTGNLEGTVAEIMARESVARDVAKEAPDVTVERANLLEDAEYKYDFKVRTSAWRRGVGVGDSTRLEAKNRAIGVQFTIGEAKQEKETSIALAKEVYAGKLPVDDVVLVRIRTKAFGDAFDAWLSAGRPPGGPEAFLDPVVRRALLTQVLVDLEASHGA